MSPLRAHVLNGRIVVDEPTDLPEGTELYLTPMNDVDDGLNDDERQHVLEMIDESFADDEAGKSKSLSSVIQRLRATQ